MHQRLQPQPSAGFLGDPIPTLQERLFVDALLFLVELGIRGKGNYKESTTWRPGWREMQAWVWGPEAGGDLEGQGPWSFAQPQNGHGSSGHEVQRAAQDALEYCSLLSPPQSIPKNKSRAGYVFQIADFLFLKQILPKLIL